MKSGNDDMAAAGVNVVRVAWNSASNLYQLIAK